MNILNYLREDADKYPDKTAVSDENISLSFSELELYARQTGQFITDTLKGSGPVPIGVFADHDCYSIAAFLGIVMSGNFYVPLDPKQPLNKLEKILADAEPLLVLGRSGEEGLLPEGYKAQFKDIEDACTSGGASTCNIEEYEADRPLYMVYTSGSTGYPKGVLKSHGAMIDFVSAFTDTFETGSNEVMGSQTPFFFDASAKDIYLMLKTGATLHIIPEEKFLLPPMLIRFLDEKKITFISWVPSALSLIAQYNTFSEMIPKTLKKVFFVGEAFPVKHLKKWQEALPDVTYVNMYGASELAGICCYYIVPDHYDKDTDIPMGKPLKNCKVFLAERYEKSPEGIRIINEPGKNGEIYLSSRALALEYYNDPEKTKGAFIEINGERIFRTGDIAWYDEEGDLHFAARNDSQIKHMGQRIELGEIESVCLTLPVIDRACCLYDQGKKRIYLFCQLSEGANEDQKSILIKLKQILVYYMMPQRVVIMDRLPLNANGKTDRQLLKEKMK